jgi:hypothetical protein
VLDRPVVTIEELPAQLTPFQQVDRARRALDEAAGTAHAAAVGARP